VNTDTQQLIGRRLGGFLLERLVGQGGFAWVFAAQDAAGTPAAVKVLKPRYAGDPQFESRFRQESETAAKLEHPNIVNIRHVGRDGDQVFFAMDLYPSSLGRWIEQEKTLPEADIVRLGIEIAEALQFAHTRGLIHRDIKVDNVLLKGDGTAILTDFGIARAVSGYTSTTGVNMTVGSPHYLAPEQAQGRPLDPRTDLYSLGVTLYKAAAGDVPFTSTDWFELARMHVEEPPPSLRKKRPELSKRFERVVFKCLAKHPDDRYETAAALVADLKEIRDRSRPTDAVGVAPVSTKQVQSIKRVPVKQRGWVAAVGVAALLLALVAVVVMLMR
jgi:eukaryotic-like serine/threonine-protein kinase